MSEIRRQNAVGRRQSAEDRFAGYVKEDTMAGKKKVQNEVQVDTIYQEMYQEMRRYRDYELTSSTWYTAFLIAILGFLITVMYGEENFDKLQKILISNLGLQVLIWMMVTTLGLASIYAVRYVNLRYEEIKYYIFDDPKTTYFRPEGIKKFSPETRKFRPVHLIYIIHILILVISSIVIFASSGLCCIFLSFALLLIVCIIIRYVFLPDLKLQESNQEKNQ
jgi:uncharacterized membrane protein